MLRLGHIDYSTCLPIHATLLEAAPQGVEIIQGTPGELNRALAAGEIDVAPCSSIEYARHAQSYRLLPNLVIGSLGPVQSIRFETRLPLEALAGQRIAVPTASASSVLLLQILLEHRYGQQAVFEWYSQESGADPIAAGCAAALQIGDIALRSSARSARAIYDLGTLWTEWTGLPFAFALWQTRLGPERDHELAGLIAQMQASRAQSLGDPLRLAKRFSRRFGLHPERLAAYWSGLRYYLDEAMMQGLLRFFGHAARLGDIPAVPEIRFVSEVDSFRERGLC